MFVLAQLLLLQPWIPAFTSLSFTCNTYLSNTNIYNNNNIQPAHPCIYTKVKHLKGVTDSPLCSSKKPSLHHHAAVLCDAAALWPHASPPGLFEQISGIALNMHVPLNDCYLLLHRGNLISLRTQSLFPSLSKHNLLATAQNLGVMWVERCRRQFVCQRPRQWQEEGQMYSTGSVCSARQRAENSGFTSLQVVIEKKWQLLFCKSQPCLNE